MPVDNEIYNRLSSTWWDEQGFLNLLRTMGNPARFGYFREVLLKQVGMDPVGKQALDVGCGGGLLAEEFARLGCQVTGLDPSEPSLATARAHARQSSLDIEYRVGVGEALPFADETFDLAYCCDVLEHVNDLAQVLSEISRVLRMGGLFFYDTINQTWQSKLLMIKLAQEWKFTSIMPPQFHDWNMFIKPQRLQELMRQQGLASQEMIGLKAAASPLAIIGSLRKHKRGELSVAELGSRFHFQQSKDTSGLYAGYAIKSAKHA
jgi:2-polyprenyl-6-hydroxyphenyl methylase / 3-demethylubiquinone-9 3-methyltransferase